MSGKPVYFGIDLGTTNSTAATFDGERITLVRNAQGGSLTPSVVRIDARANVTVGARARRFLDTDPENTRAEFKRLMGTSQRLDFAASRLQRRPEELAAEVLKALRADAQDQLGFAPERAVVTVPALFELPQSSATSEAARLAGFERVELLQEPVASALAAGWSEQEAAGSWLVYDLGGGTFDASLLETRDGLLRVVGHDGDNFLGGRDFDSAIVDWALGELSRLQHVEISRANPGFAAGIRKLRHAVEEAKIELARSATAALTIPEAFFVDSTPIDVDLVIDRATLERLCQPLVDRSILVCERLLATHSVDARGLARVVLVGGPTVMPMLRDRVSKALSAPFGEGLDPMTLVAQGAAIYAATARLDARPVVKSGQAGRKIWLQYPAMTSDLTPHVVGRLVAETSGTPTPVEVTLRRDDDRWKSTPSSFDEEGAFFSLVELVARRPNVFHLEAVSLDGTPVPLDPPSITIMQGLTISDPPLSRSIGVALASNYVQVYFERGSPLPAKRRFVHHTVETVAKGSGDCLLRIPIVQGEFEMAHLCRLVGSLEISGVGVNASLPAGAQIEVTIKLDRGGRLSARALVPALNQVFEHVAQLVIPDATPASLDSSRKALLERLTDLRGEALRRGAMKSLDRLTRVEHDLNDVARDISAAKGGDADAGQKARRTLLEIDASLEEAEADKRWPELESRAGMEFAWASGVVAIYGTPPEKRLIEEVGSSMEKARKHQNAAELQRQLRVARNLGNASYFRKPDAWSEQFDHMASRVDDCSDLPRAESLIREGRKAQARKDDGALRGVVQQLWSLMPVDRDDRRLGFDSGVR
jgi:molecular chaperone DnaK